MRNQAQPNSIVPETRPMNLPGLIPDRIKSLFTARTTAVSSSESSWRQHALAFFFLAAVTLFNLGLQWWIGHQAIAFVYLLAVVLLALFVGRGPILFGSVLTALGWSFFFAPPKYSFRIAGDSDQMMVVIYFLVALTVGQLTARLRAQRLAEQQREERATALYLLTRELADSADAGEIFSKVVRQVGTVFSAEVSLLLPDANNPLGFTASPAGTWLPGRDEQDVAVWAFEQNQPAGRGTPIRPQVSGLHLPLSAGRAPAGVMSLRPKAGGEFSLYQRNLLEHFVRQIALVLDRQRLRDAEINNKLLAESERLSRTLLNSVSHELRTPIAAITSAASELRSSESLTGPHLNLATEIESASARLNRVVQSLLSAARLQSGQVRARLDWCDARDIVQTALRGAEDLIHNRTIEVKVASGLPLVRVDSVLMEQALGNLLANAATHTPPGTPIEISARVEGRDLVLEVADRGAGLPADQLERIFDLFHRAPNAKPGGTGLGLPIVKGFIEAQGSRVQAANRRGGGAAFTVFIPITHTPDLPEETA